MSRIISPDIQNITNLRQQLTKGERSTFEAFNKHLSPEWEIYIQPHLNGLRPDFVLLNPNVGIGIFEVKDWDLDAMRRYVEIKNEKSIMMGEINGEKFEIKDNPITKIIQYRNAIFDLYCPRLDRKFGLDAITAGVIFPFAETKRINSLLTPFISAGNKNSPYYPISGIEDVTSGDMKKMFPESMGSSYEIMSEEASRDLRGWLVEPDFASAQRDPIRLDRMQNALLNTWPTSGYRRIKGPAGSGKSIVLATRAAHRATMRKSVLIVTYNITLWHYLRDLVVRALYNRDLMENVEFSSFHHWCKTVCIDGGMEKRYDALFVGSDEWTQKQRSEVLDVKIPAIAADVFKSGYGRKYDTILVDEGQDYRLDWWNVLRYARKSDGEMLLVADTAQDVYGTAMAWTEEAMTGAGFSGGSWSKLSGSHRSPAIARHYASEYTKQFLTEESVNMPETNQGSLDVERCHLRWVQCHDSLGAISAVEELVRLMHETGGGGVSNSDICFLIEDIKVGRRIVAKLSEKGILTSDTFAESSREQRRQKMSFWMGSAKIKATTPQSFKGWEARLIVVYISKFKTSEDRSVVYAALTRLKRCPEGSCMTVVCVSPELAEYGSTWPEHETRMAAPALPSPHPVFPGLNQSGLVGNRRSNIKGDGVMSP